MKKKLLLLIALAGGISLYVAAQQSPAPAPQPAAEGASKSAARHFVIGNSDIVPLQSKVTGRAHELIIVYPESYYKDPNKKFPVFYYLDAYWDTPLVVSAYGNLVYDKLAPEFIMVGLSYPDAADVGKERMRDYTYTSVFGAFGSGKGDKFLEFIKTEVAPLIESKYRGEKTNRVIGGGSLGGLFAIGAALKDPDFFTGYIAMSPAVIWDNGAIFKLEQEFAAKKRPLNARMYINVGGLEPADYRDQVLKFGKQLGARQYPGLALQTQVAEGLAHGTVKNEGYLRGLKWVWEGKQK